MNTTEVRRLLLGFENRSGRGILMSLKLAGTMSLLQIDVRLKAAGHAIALVVRNLLHNFRWGAEYETAWRDDRAFGDEGTGANNTPSTYHGIVQDDRADADEAIILHFGAVDYGAMADCDAFADRTRNSGVGVEDGAVLNVGFVVDFYLVSVGADYGGGPDAGAVS
jgi:hypothetical protein